MTFMPAMSPARMGLPVDRLVVATNVSDILVRTFATGAYEIRDVIATTSPSMDIQVSSNFERLLFDAYGRDAQAVRALMGSLAQNRRFTLSGIGAQGAALAIHCRSRRRAGGRRRDSRVGARSQLLRRSAHRRCAGGSGKEKRDPSVPMVVVVDCASRKISRCDQGGMRCRPGAA